MWLCPRRRPRGVGADRGAGNVPHVPPPRPCPMAHHPGRASRPLLTPAWHLARPQSHTRHASTSIPLTRRGAGPDAQLRAGARPAPRPDAKPAHPRSFRRHPFCLTYPESFHALTAPLDKLSPGFEGHQKAHLQVLSPDGPTLLAQAFAGVAHAPNGGLSSTRWPRGVAHAILPPRAVLPGRGGAESWRLALGSLDPEGTHAICTCALLAAKGQDTRVLPRGPREARGSAHPQRLARGVCAAGERDRTLAPLPPLPPLPPARAAGARLCPGTSL